MDDLDATAAAKRLVEARRRRVPLPCLPLALRPTDLASAHRIQKALNAELSGSPIGYKLGATSVKAQALLGLHEPITGRLFRETSHPSPAELPATDFIFRLVEPEFAFTLGTTLPARTTAFTTEEVAAAVGAIHPAMEVVSSAYGLDHWREVGAASLVADNAAHGAFVYGPPTHDWHGLDLPRQIVRLSVDGEPFGEGVGANALGNPLIALTWLANHLRSLGKGLEAGEIVTTGVVTPFPALEAGQRATADFGPLGRVSVAFR